MFCEEMGHTIKKAAACDVDKSALVNRATRQGTSCSAGWACWVVGDRVSHSGSGEGSSNGEDGLELHFEDLELELEASKLKLLRVVFGSWKFALEVCCAVDALDDERSIWGESDLLIYTFLH